MNKIMLRGKWRQARGGMKAEWGRLTENERHVLEGRIDQLLGLFQERYGFTRERAAKAVEHYLHLQAKKPEQTVAMPPTVRNLFFAAIGLVIISAGWFTLMQLLGEKQPPLEREMHDDVGEFEPEDFEAMMMGYDGVLDKHHANQKQRS